MSFFNNNFTGMNFGHPSVDEEFPYFGTPYTDTFDLEALIAGPSGSQNLNPDPPTVGYADQSGHQESTLLDASGNQFVDPYTPQMAPTYDHYAGMNVYGLNADERLTNIPGERAGPSVGDLAAVSRYHSFAMPTAPPLAASHGPIAPHSTIPRPDAYAPLQAPSYAAGVLPYGAYEQPLADSSSNSQWSYPYLTASVDEGRAQATDQYPLHPVSAGNQVWWHQQPHTFENYGGPPPQTVLGVPPNTDTPAQIASSSGPQRSKRSVRDGGNALQKGRGRRRRNPAEPLPEGADSNWGQTKDRFAWEMFEEYCFRPAGRSINPEAAFATLTKFIKEDLHRSPFAAQAAKAKAKAEGKDSRVYEQYLTHILMELRRSETGETENEVLMYTRVLEQLERELAPINSRRVLRDGVSKKKDSSELDNSAGKVKHRKAEQRRRTAIRSLQNRISVFFLVRGQGKVSVGDLLLFVVVYLKMGKIAFPGLINPRPTSQGQ